MAWEDSIADFYNDRIKPLARKLKLDKLFKPKPKVAVIQLHGVIGAVQKLRPSSGLTAQSLQPILDKAFQLPKLKAVALSINCPGGSPVQSALIFEAIRRLADKHEVPVYSFIEDVGASGGYWLACAGEKIYAMDASVVGSIGVISSSFGLHKFIERYDIERRVYTQGENKSMLDPFQPEKPEDVERLLDAQKDIHAAFKSLVRERRGESLKEDEDSLFSGAFWSGTQAEKLGLVDEIGVLHNVMYDMFGDEIDIVPVEAPKPLFAKLLGMDSFSPSAFTDAAITTVEERSLWSRYGL
tara:strand:+ start:568 stop:1461 length:894 start_codon:yes stop_codon:yes gene_type:complete